MQTIKAVVILMGLLIVAGLALIVYSLVARVPGDKDAARGFGETSLALPAGCSLAEAHLEDGRLVLRADGPAERGCQQVIVLDPVSGGPLGRVTVAPTP